MISIYDIFSNQQFIFRGNEVAVIYGGLPPGTKLAQAAKFNDINNSCKVMVATDGKSYTYLFLKN